MPGFLGGSNLAVPITSSGDKAAAADWVKAFTDTASQRTFQSKGNIPNATTLLGKSVNERAALSELVRPDGSTGSTSRTAASSATCSRTQITAGRLTIKQAASSASDNIASVLQQALVPTERCDRRGDLPVLKSPRRRVLTIGRTRRARPCRTAC